MIRTQRWFLALAAILCAASVRAEVTVGVSLGVTGPGASLGINYKNAFQLMPKTIGGQPVKFVILDDGSDPSTTAKNARKLVVEDKADVLMGSNGVPSALQMIQVGAESGTPVIALTPLPPISPDRARWTFIVAQSLELMMGAVAEHIKARKAKTIGYIGYSDTLGDIVLRAMEHHADSAGYRIVASERYARSDSSVTGQVLKLLAARPDVVVVGGTGSGAALPHVALVERGYKGQIYHTHGTVNADFIKVGGSKVEGAIAATGPLIVPEELPGDYPTKAISQDFTKRYEAMFGAGSRNAFAGYSYDGVLLLNAAVPIAMKKAKPGTAEFRQELRNALENVKNVVATHGVFNMSGADHNGLDERARVLVRVHKGSWSLLK